MQHLEKSIMTTYRLSNGDRIQKSIIDRNVSKAKQQKLENMKDEYGYIFCEVCSKSGGEYLDCSHDISVDKCQKLGQSEKAWDTANITVRCRPCHRKHDNTY